MRLGVGRTTLNPWKHLEGSDSRAAELGSKVRILDRRVGRRWMPRPRGPALKAPPPPPPCPSAHLHAVRVARGGDGVGQHAQRAHHSTRALDLGTDGEGRRGG